MCDPLDISVIKEYQPEWVSLPEFSSWLLPDPTSSSHALCSLCNIRLEATLATLRQHTTASHPSCAPLTPRPLEQRRSRYNPEWRRRPELSAWLRRSPHNPDFAFCRSCNKELRPALNYLRRHAVCRLHQRRSQRLAAETSACPLSSGASSEAGVSAPDGAVDTVADGGDRKRRRITETIKAWQRRPEFAPWLRCSAVEGNKAFCLVCYKEFTAKLVFVRRHAESGIHRRRMTSMTAAISERKRDGELSKEVPGSDLETVEACDLDAEWTPDGQTNPPSKEAVEPTVEGHQETSEYWPVLQPRADFSPSPSPVPSLTPGGDSAAARPARRTDYTAYNPAWERRPELAGWLARAPDRPRHAYCRVCRTEVTPKLAHVRRHGASRRHVRKLQQAEHLEWILPDSAQEVELGNQVVQVEANLGTKVVVVEAGAGDEVTADTAYVRATAEDQHESTPAEVLNDEAPLQTANDDDQTPETQTPLRRQLVYQTLWEERPELRDWLGRSPWDPSRPFCRWCHREVTAKLAHLRRHAQSSLHRRAEAAEKGRDDSKTRREAAERTVAASETAVDDDSGEKAGDSCRPVELGPFGTCLVCKHPLVVRLNIFRSRTRPSRRPVAAVLSAMLQRPFSEEGCGPALSEICTACASLLDAADELRTKLTAIEDEVRLKFRSPSPLIVRPPSVAEGGPPEEGGPGPLHQPVTEDSTGLVQGSAEPLEEADLVLEGEPVAFITIGDADQEDSAVVVRTETLENGDLVVYREPVELAQPEPPADVFSDSPGQPEESPLEQAPPVVASEPGPHPTGPAPSDHLRPVPQRPRSAGGQRLFSCVFCQRDFITSLALHQHWNAAHPHQLRPCPHCPKRFLHSSSLKQHIRTHEERCYTCEQCGKRFAANCDLKKHMIFVHSEVKRFPCDVCGRAFKLKWMLGRHVRLVHEDEPDRKSL